MNASDTLIFTAAVLALLAGHAARSLRQRLLFPEAATPRASTLLLGLSCGYLVNAALPLHLGEVARVALVARKTRIAWPTVGATVLAERLSDVILLGVAGLVWMAVASAQGAALVAGPLALLTVAAACLAGVAIATRSSAAMRRAAWMLASLFNDRIRDGLLDLAWRFADIVATRQLIGRSYLTLSGLVWSLYATAYILFGNAVGEPAGLVAATLLGMPQSSLAGQAAATGIPAAAIISFTLLPVAAVGAYAVIRGSRKAIADERLRPASRPSGGAVVREDFLDPGDYSTFLGAHFGGSDALVSQFGVRGMPDGRVRRLFTGGSDAVIALIDASDGSPDGVIRKFATGASADKLAAQATWLREHDARLPLASIIAERAGEGHRSYDMPYDPDSREFHAAIHTAALAESTAMLSAIIDTLATFHADTACGVASNAAVDAYLASKVAGNARSVLAFARERFPDGAITINGEQVSLDAWSALTDPAWLSAQIYDRRISAIHGDLTVENIIVSSNCPRGWFLIDPNPGNGFDTPLIDWAKLMQSLHLGYESLNRGVPVAVRKARIEIGFARSAATSHLHRQAELLIAARLGEAALREIAFHEIVNYLRLTPYKIRQDERKGLLFFACTSLLLRDYLAADGSRRRIAA